MAETQGLDGEGRDVDAQTSRLLLELSISTCSISPGPRNFARRMEAVWSAATVWDLWFMECGHRM
jgi:hypothetical protein